VSGIEQVVPSTSHTRRPHQVIVAPTCSRSAPPTRRRPSRTTARGNRRRAWQYAVGAADGILRRPAAACSARAIATASRQELPTSSTCHKNVHIVCKGVQKRSRQRYPAARHPASTDSASHGPQTPVLPVSNSCLRTSLPSAIVAIRGLLPCPARS